MHTLYCTHSFIPHCRLEEYESQLRDTEENNEKMLNDSQNLLNSSLVSTSVICNPFPLRAKSQTETPHKARSPCLCTNPQPKHSLYNRGNKVHVYRGVSQ